MVHGILQFTPSIAFRYVLHRCESRDIRCRESFVFTEEARVPPTHAADGARGAGCRFEHSLALSAPGFVGRPPRAPGRARRGRGGGARAECRSTPPARAPRLLNAFAGSFCCAGFDNDPSAGSPTETLLRLLLPLNDKVQWTSRDVAGSEPPTSPRSEHFTGSFNRQIAPPTKNGHAPPPIESRKSSQSVNPYYAWTWRVRTSLLEQGSNLTARAEYNSRAVRPNAPSMRAQHRPQRPAIDAVRCCPCGRCKAEASPAGNDSPPVGGEEEMKARRGSCTGATHVGRRRSSVDWSRPHACSPWSLPRRQHPVLVSRTIAPPHPNSSASSSIADNATDSRHERTMKHRRRCYRGTDDSYGLAIHAAIHPRCSPAWPLSAYANYRQSP
ncbi:hypothetical protein CQW23_35177 [Capsicum baccatum]|uniref:Protein TAR1 n=1 Tax=Capsicum baccatum TaxID=33114 RepID=A0A2G2UWY4_CAPBA|nr:hypothetical protein CQW23_35177 [Capsicum baccatum]